MDTEFDRANEGVSSSYVDILTTVAKTAQRGRLAALADLSFVGGRAGDSLTDWRADIESALFEAFPRLAGMRRERLFRHFEDLFIHGTEARLVDLARPREDAIMLARARALSNAARVKLKLAGRGCDADAEVGELAWTVAFETPSTSAEAARAAIDALADVGLTGGKFVATAALKCARQGSVDRGGDVRLMAHVATEAMAAADLTDPSWAIASVAMQIIERMPSALPEDAVAHALEAADFCGISALLGNAAEVRALQHATETKRKLEAAAEAEEEPPYGYSPPPTWWVRHWENPDHFNLETEPGLLGELARWSVSYAFRPVPEFAALVALATLAPLYCRRFATPTNAGLNLYLTALAETGGGKEAVQGAPPALLSAAKLEFLLGACDFTSDSAIELALRSRPNFIATIDEVSDFIGNAQHRNAPAHSRTIRKALLELYSKSRSDARWSGKQKVDADNPDKASTPIYAPHLSILGCATVEGYFAVLTEDNMSGGFVNRWVVFRGSKPTGWNTDPARIEVPEELSKALSGAYANTTEGNLSNGFARDPLNKPQMRVVPWGQDGEEAWFEVLTAQEEAADAGGRDIVGRAAENCLKIATIRALARDGLAAAVTEHDVHWAWSIVRASIATVQAGARENMAGSEFEALVKAMEKHVVAAGPDGIALSELLKKRGVGKHTDAVVETALKRLEKLGVIYAPTVGTGPKGGRPGIRVKARQFFEG